MQNPRPPYTLFTTVMDADGDQIARTEINYTDPNDALRAFGHATEAVNLMHRDERRAREKKAAAEQRHPVPGSVLARAADNIAGSVE